MDAAFQFHSLNQSGVNKAEFIAIEFDHLLERLMELCGEPKYPFSREFSLVRTKLEEASMFAKKSMSMKPENQVVGIDQ